MLYRIITGDRFITACIIFLIAAGIWIPSILSPEIIIDDGIVNSMPLYRFFSKFLEERVILSRFLTFGLLLFEAFLLVRINAKFVLVQQRTFLPALFFIIGTGYSPVLMQWDPFLPASIFVILVLEIIFRSYKEDPNSYRYFEAGIILGLGSLFYAPLLFMLVFIWIACLVQRPFFWREYLYPLLGFMIPYVFILGYLFLTDKSLSDFYQRISTNI